MKNHIFNLCRGKDVLQIGVLGDIDNYIKNNKLEDWDFSNIKKVAKTAAGVDINKEGLEKAIKIGITDIKFGDAENLDLNKKFDVIYAGDLIEHLNNIGKFLESCKKHMKQDSILVLTTPSPYSLNMIIRSFFKSAAKGIFNEHTVLLHEKNLKELLRRFSFEINTIKYYTTPDKRTIFSRIGNILMKIASFYNSEFNQNYILIASLENKNN
ncbi:MAG: methyltransferase domain-containing protein [Chlorobiota bacterium]|nr:MAG: methyltransferase domain-containing protein [Chlorobiota bacterium]